ncbi:MAG: hypothetical protein J0G97_10750, partial [Rhizobium pusense]|nr:hypothetical protein [Agrobacterium pusense]
MARIAMPDAAMKNERMPCMIQTFLSRRMWAFFFRLARGFSGLSACRCHKSLTQVRHGQFFRKYSCP